MSSSRDFDITWLPPVKTSEMGQKGAVSGAEPAAVGDEALLQAFGGDTEQRLHVVDMAKLTGMGFDEALQGVLRLVAADRLELVKRDEMGSDHIVALTPGGQAASGSG